MTMYSFNKQYPVLTKPERIRLSDGTTKTDSTTFDNADLTDAGWQVVEDKPNVDVRTHKVSWDGTKWVTESLSDKELKDIKNRDLQSYRIQRDKLIDEVEWKIMRYHSFARQGKSQIDDIVVLDKYIQDLRDCINIDDPSSTELPVPPNDFK